MRVAKKRYEGQGYIFAKGDESNCTLQARRLFQNRKRRIKEGTNSIQEVEEQTDGEERPSGQRENLTCVGKLAENTVNSL